MSGNIVTTFHAPSMGREQKSCLMCGTEFFRPKHRGQPRLTCSDKCRQELHRLKLRQGEACLHSRWGTGKITVNAKGIWHEGPRGTHLVFIQELRGPSGLQFIQFQKPSKSHKGRYEARRWDVRRKRVWEPLWPELTASLEPWGIERSQSSPFGRGNKEILNARNPATFGPTLLVRRMKVALGSESAVRKIPIQEKEQS